MRCLIASGIYRDSTEEKEGGYCQRLPVNVQKHGEHMKKTCRPGHPGFRTPSPNLSKSRLMRFQTVSNRFNRFTFIDWNSFGCWLVGQICLVRSVKGQLYTWGKGPATGFDAEDVITTPRQAGKPTKVSGLMVKKSPY